MNEEVEREFPFIFLMGALYLSHQTIFLILNMCVRTPEIPCGSGAMQLPGFQQMAYAIGSRSERVRE